VARRICSRATALGAGKLIVSGGEKAGICARARRKKGSSKGRIGAQYSKTSRSKHGVRSGKSPSGGILDPRTARGHPESIGGKDCCPAVADYGQDKPRG